VLSEIREGAESRRGAESEGVRRGKEY